MKYQPYPKYKDSGVEWIGEIPEGWDSPRLRRYVSIRNGADYKDFEQDEPGFPVFGSGGQFAYVDRFVHQGPSVLLGRKGTIDRPLFVSSPFWTVDTMFYCEISGDLDAKFLYYFCTTIQFDFYSTATALPSMTQADYGSMVLPRPDLRVQSVISAFLDRETAKIDTLVRDYEDLIALLTEKRQALISHAVTQGLSELVDADDPEFGEWCKPVRFRDSGVEWLGEIPEGWDATRVKNLFALIVEPAPDGNEEELLSIYTAIGVRPRKELEQKGNKSTTTDGYWRVRRGDFIVNKLLAWMGAIGLSDYDGVTSPAYDILRPKQAIAPYLYHELFRMERFSQEMKKYSRGIMDMRLRLYFEEFGTIVVPFAPLGEQTAIAAFLTRETTKIDTLICETQDAIELLKEHRSALITAAVTGKINVEGLE